MTTIFLNFLSFVCLLFLTTELSLAQQKTSKAKEQMNAALYMEKKLSETSNVNMSTLGIEDGLSNNSVNKKFKEKFGHIWFRPDDGVNRCDGYEFKIFTNARNNTSSIISNRIICLADDEEGNIWVGTNSGLSIYHNYSPQQCKAFGISDPSKHAGSKVVQSAFDGKPNQQWLILQQ
ncbi:ligand-binding sensor domain-containing protein [Pedobacter sp. UYEF25]